ncbi:ribosome-recycling factor, chloroplastic-like [Actinidia eriantha]|uniref:ribosome-recycling factor, chloroplastic-like n=1 Tax=Actinidia eriantha TaxID=165200 RepID=UPI00258FFCA2|nr:ribosome-recycling factor, chloroplastic-like [Actinidia eriantha]
MSLSLTRKRTQAVYIHRHVQRQSDQPLSLSLSISSNISIYNGDIVLTSPNPVRTTYHQPKHGLNPPKAILSLRNTYLRGPNCQQCDSRFRGVVSYVTVRAGTRRTAGKSLAVKRVSERRTGIIRCATIEEIEAQKYLIEKSVKEKMEKTIESVRSNFNSMRTARANPSILDWLEVEYYGTPVNVKSIAQISAPDASSILVQPYDKSRFLAIYPRKARYILVALRNIRREAIKAYKKLEKEKKLSEDNVKDLSSDFQTPSKRSWVTTPSPSLLKI